MSTPLKTTPNMRKHLTVAERSARENAEQSLQRGRVQIRAPRWLGDVAREIFDVTKRRLRGLGLLDTVDADLLALYADAIAKYQAAIIDHDAKPETAQAWSRVALAYAEKLGISPSARARLARQRAEKAVAVDPMDALLGEVAEYVNGAGDGR